MLAKDTSKLKHRRRVQLLGFVSCLLLLHRNTAYSSDRLQRFHAPS